MSTPPGHSTPERLLQLLPQFALPNTSVTTYQLLGILSQPGQCSAGKYLAIDPLRGVVDLP